MYKKVLMFSLFVLGCAVALCLIAHADDLDGANQAQGQMVIQNLSQMPLAFTENQGQFGDKICFRANALGASFFFTPGVVIYQFTRRYQDEEDHLQLGKWRIDYFQSPFEMRENSRLASKVDRFYVKAKFIGANPNPEIVGEGLIAYKCNYFIGNDPSKWRTDVSNYGAVVYKDIYPGIDLKYYGDGRAMKYDFIVSPGADPSQIQVRYEGVKSLQVNQAGELIVETEFGTITEHAPRIFQIIDGVKRVVQGEYLLKAEDTFGFKLTGTYNSTHPLIIDPTLTYSTYLGGSDGDGCGDIAVDAAGNAYVAGGTWSSDLPTENPFDGTWNGDLDAFVAKFSPSGNSLIYSTYLGGSDFDAGREIAIDHSGNVYVTGWTWSSDFPTTPGAFDETYNFEDAFVTKLSPAGNSLVYSTYLGGIDYDEGGDIAIDSDGNAYVTGSAGYDFPTTPGAFDRTLGGNQDAFVTKFSPSGNTLIYSTYLGGSGDQDRGNGITVDAGGNAYVTGETYSSDFPTENPFDGTLGGYSDAFVTKLSPSGNSLIYSTYLGGSYDDDYGYGIAVDAGGSAYVTGETHSSDFPTENPFDGTYNGYRDAFVTKLSPGGNSLVYSTYLGGSGEDLGGGIAVDADGNAYVTGCTKSSDFPTQNPFDGTYNGGYYDAFVTKLSPPGNSLIYSTYLGGSNWDDGCGIAVDADGNAYVTGYTESSDFPTANPFDGTYNGEGDAFVTKFSDGENQPPTVEITSPGDGENVGGEVLIMGTAEDYDGTIDRVDIKIDDGDWILADGTTNWSYEWDATGVDPGAHTIFARSFDNLGAQSTVKSVDVFVDNTEYTRQDIVQAIQELGAVVDSQIIQSTWYLACQHAYLLKDIYEKPDVKDDFVNALGKAASAAELAINLIDLNPGSIIMSVAAEFVLAEALNRFHDENIAACKAFVDHIYGPEGLNPDDPIPTLQEQMFELLKTYQEGPYVLQVLAGLDILFWYATGSIPDPLPPNYPTREVVSYIRDIKGDFDYRNRGRSWIMKWFSPDGYDAADPSDDDICLYQKMGAIKDYYENSKLIYEDAFPQEEKNYEMIGTGQKWSIGAGGVVALLGVVVCFIPGGQLVGAAMIVGGLAVPSTIYLVGTVAQKTVDLNYDRVLASWGVTSFEQLYEEMHNSFTLADNLDEYVQDPIVFSPNSIDIIDAYVPDIFLGEDENVGKATGWIDVKNVGNQAGKVNFFGDILLENGGSVLCATVMGAQEIVELLPGQTEQIGFEFYAPDVVDMFQRCEKYSIKMYVSIGGAVISATNFPELADKLRFYVGPEEYYPGGKDQTVTALIADKILEGDTVTTSFITESTTKRIEFLLDYVRGDLNLHIYDELGNHVGYNSSTEEDEINIPNSLYSGSFSFPELVTIYQSSAQEYTVKVVGVNTQGFERFLVTAIETPERPATINVTPNIPLFVTQPCDTVERLLMISEINGQHDADGIQITATDLVFNSHIIPSSNISFDLPSTVVPAGSLLTVQMSIEIPVDASPGEYTGEVHVSSTTGGSDEVNITLVVNSSPNPPVMPSGPATVFDHFPYSYSTSTTDPEDDSIYYMFHWGDETGSDWYGPFDSGDACTASHAWTEPDTYYVKVKAMDVWSYMSDWSDSLAVSVALLDRGDANGDGKIDIADVVYLVNYLFIDGPAPDPLEAGDANCDGSVNIADVVYLVNYLFIEGPPPGC